MAASDGPRLDYLAADLAKGDWPTPTCTTGEMAMHLAVEDAPTYLEDRPAEGDHNALPEHEDDYSYHDLLFQDHDVLMLLHSKSTGIEDPDHPVNEGPGVGDLREAARSDPLGNRSIRDHDAASGGGPQLLVLGDRADSSARSNGLLVLLRPAASFSTRPPRPSCGPCAPLATASARPSNPPAPCPE